MIIKKKKNGFTLIELIAVIAILAILAAILVPKISGYSTSAKQAKSLADAKIITNAVAAYNADEATQTAANQILDGATLASVTVAGTSTGLDAVIGTGKAIPSTPTEFTTTYTITQLKALALLAKSSITFDASTGKVSNP